MRIQQTSIYSQKQVKCGEEIIGMRKRICYHLGVVPLNDSQRIKLLAIPGTNFPLFGVKSPWLQSYKTVDVVSRLA
jgi:hypothetical protein